jgi:hypothetical protein
MGKNLTNVKRLIENNDPYKSKMKQAQLLANKWEETGLLEGLKDYERSNMAILLENQARELIKESTTTGNTVGSEEWSGVALPLVRRVFGELPSKEFVSVQPMNLPSGLVFYINFKYGTTKLPFTDGESIKGITSESNVDAYGGFYGAGKFTYSSNNFTSSVLGIDTGSAITWADVNYDADLSASVEATTETAGIFKLRIPVSAIDEYDETGVRGFAISGSASSSFDEYYPQFTKKVGTNIQFIVSASSDNFESGSTGLTVFYQKQPIAYDRGDFEENSTNSPISIPEIDIEFRSEAIVAKTKKLKAVWTPEISQDLQAYHAIDAEQELTTMLSEHVTMEIDLEILDMLINAASTTDYWSANPGVEYNANTGAFATNSQYYISDKSTWYQTLGIKLQKVSNKIHQKTMRGGANFVVVSPDVATIFESMPGYMADTDGNQMQFAMGVKKVGALNNRLTVYKNPYMKENVILIGYRGSTFLETGAVFAPYIPLIMSPLIYDPDTFVPRKAVMTRYAKKMVRPEFYGKVIVHGLNTV